jgi:ABC-2 type transport system permease protein
VRPALVIAGRDLRAALDTPLAYVLFAVFLLVSGLLFVTHLHDFSAASDLARAHAARDPAVLERFSLDTAVMRPVLRNSVLLLVVLVPLLTMRLLAEEERQGTMELLLTAPISPFSLVAGKWLAGLALALVPVALTLWYPLVLVVVGAPDLPPLLAGYLGLLLVAGAFTAVGLFASALTRTPLLAAFLGFAFLLASALCGVLAGALPEELGGPLAWLSILFHHDTLAAGVVDTSDLAFFVLFTACVLFLTARLVESRRWR